MTAAIPVPVEPIKYDELPISSWTNGMMNRSGGFMKSE